MQQKNERIEIRLDEQLVNAVDDWRRAQGDLPTRSEAIRRLLDRALSDNATQAEFELARFQIKTAALTPGVKERISSAHVFAWDAGVYPIHLDDTYAKPFDKYFAVNKDMFSRLMLFLDKEWLNKKLYTFYGLEDHLRIRQGDSEWDRGKLIDALRYAYLLRLFDKDFWSEMVKPMKHPSEASCICDDFDPEQDLYFQ